MFWLDQGSSLYIKDSDFDHIDGLGIFDLANSWLFVENTVFNSFNATHSGALIYVNPGHAEFTNSKIRNGRTAQNGMIYVSGFTSNIALDGCKFENNTADQESVIVFSITNQ